MIEDGAREDGNTANDRELGMGRAITRRDFLNGVAIGIGALGVAGNALGASNFPQDQPGYYPPTLTGMRGSHDGSYDYAHALRDANYWKTASRPVNTREVYDLVIAGGGISGLAAAHFYRAHNPSARILIIDNHDDFGGHAKRNEFHIGRSTLITNGGTQSIESPFDYSKEALGLMNELGIEPAKLSAESSELADRTSLAGLQSATFFDKETFGEDRLVVGAPGGGGRGGGGRGRGRGGSAPAPLPWKEWLAKTPLSEAVQRDIARLEEDSVDYMPGLSSDEKKDRLSRISYKDFLLNFVKVDPGVIPYYQKRTHGLYGVGIDAVGALEVWPRYPGFRGMNIDPGPFHRLSFTAMGEHVPKTVPYNYHFPDGNASIARSLVRKLVPGSAPGNTAEDIVTAKFDYSALDREQNQVRIRLEQHRRYGRATWAIRRTRKKSKSFTAERKKLYSVRAKSVVLACWNMMIPYVCPELPEKQKEALKYGVKVPLCYIAVGLRQLARFRENGHPRRIRARHVSHRESISSRLPGSATTFRKSRHPDEPILVRTGREPCKPGLSAREQQLAGHIELLSTPFSTFERNIRDQMVRILGPGGFDPARDIEAITVNRWPHGYAYEYNFLWDPEWPKGESPARSGASASAG